VFTGGIIIESDTILADAYIFKTNDFKVEKLENMNIARYKH
jgi:hypothetical protein